jgi:hypothetical protein
MKTAYNAVKLGYTLAEIFDKIFYCVYKCENYTTRLLLPIYTRIFQCRSLVSSGIVWRLSVYIIS